VTKVQLGDAINDRYEVIEPLGYGGMAQVYRAKDRHLGREVAVKILRPSLTDSDQARFLREIRILASLSHPNVVRIYDLGTDQGAEDVVYFVMELVDGGMVTELGPFETDLEPALALLDAAINMAKALAYVHRQGIIHRDLTPHNILLTAQGEVKIMDFGLIHLAAASRLTRTGRTLGTPQYMAPEQAKGEALDARADLYALGAVLFHMLTGGPPFAADSDQAVLFQHVYETLNLPHDINPHVPHALSQIVAQLLDKRPDRRPHSGDAVAAALELVRAQMLQQSQQQRLGGGGQRGFIAGGVVRPDLLEPRWQAQLEGGMQWPAALTAAEGFVLAGLRDECVAVIHPDDGRVLARFDAADEINSPLSYQRGLLSYCSRSGGLYAVRYPAGTAAWQDEHAQAVGSVALGRYLLVSGRYNVRLLEHETGAEQWRWHLSKETVDQEKTGKETGSETGQAGDTIITPPTLHGQQLFVMTQSGWLLGLHLLTGNLLFKAHVGVCRAQASAAERVLLIPEHVGAVHGLDLDTFEVLWSYDLEGKLWATPLIWQQQAYVVSWSGIVRCLQLRTGDDIWECEIGVPVTAAPVLAAGHLYAVTETGELIVLDVYSGKCCYRERVSDSPCQVSPLLLEGKVIVAAADGTLLALSTPH
jgi:eukaryotic-like serine/threonine-protein kinase